MMDFHQQNIKVTLPVLTMNGTQIECTDNFKFLSIDLKKIMDWKSHVNIIARKNRKLLAFAKDLNISCLSIHIFVYTIL